MKKEELVNKLFQMIALEESPLKVMEVLIQEGADINQTINGFGQTWAIRWAIRNVIRGESQDTFDFMNEHGADINIQDNSGRTALMYAAKKDYCDIVDTIFSAFRNVDTCIVDNEGKTALMHAVIETDNHSIISPLIDPDNIIIKSKDGLTATDYWREKWEEHWGCSEEEYMEETEDDIKDEDSDLFKYCIVQNELIEAEEIAEKRQEKAKKQNEIPKQPKTVEDKSGNKFNLKNFILYKGAKEI